MERGLHIISRILGNEISGITGTKALDRLRKFMERAPRPRYMTPTGEDLALLSRVSRVR